MNLFGIVLMSIALMIGGLVLTYGVVDFISRIKLLPLSILSLILTTIAIYTM